MATTDPGPTTIRLLTDETWPLFEALVDRHGGIFGGCWCIWFHPDCVRETDDEDDAVAWAEDGTPEELPTIHHRAQYEKDLVAAGESPPDHRITCIFVDRRVRRHGLVTVALHGALDLIAQAGGGVVEGYPHLPPEKKMSSSFLYNGTRAVYERAGFEFVRTKGKRNTVMRRTVAGAA